MSKNNICEAKQNNKSIPINLELLNKYKNISDLINIEINNCNINSNVTNELIELQNLDTNKISNNELYHTAVDIFEKYNNKRIFKNDGNEIIVSNGDIKESINKIYYNKNQKKLLKEHLQVFADLGHIIEKSTLAGQTIENKNRENNYIWSYYLNGLKINKENYLFEFDVVSRSNNENHYRVQRLQKIKKQMLQLETLLIAT